MALDLADCSFSGPALPASWVRSQLERWLRHADLLPQRRGAAGKLLQADWDSYRRGLAALGDRSDAQQVAQQVLAPLCQRLGYPQLSCQPAVTTNSGEESGGFLSATEDAGDGAARLRVWSVALATELDAPPARGLAARFSPGQAAQRVLYARGEALGLLTNGRELRLLLREPARRDSHLAIRLDGAGGWRTAGAVPDSFRLLRALASPAGARRLGGLIAQAHLAQTAVTAKLRLQARQAVEDFVSELLLLPDNRAALAHHSSAALAEDLWREGLILVYRLLFICKLESPSAPERAFRFTATPRWRRTCSPRTALAPRVRRVLAGAPATGQLAAGLRELFRLFAAGSPHPELPVGRLGGLLFGAAATPLLDSLTWSELAVARLLDPLLWIEPADKPAKLPAGRERVDYAALEVEELGRVYEALLELAPGLSSEPMCRLRRDKLEVVVPRSAAALPRRAARSPAHEVPRADGDSAAPPEPPELAPGRAGARSRVVCVEQIPAGRFFLRVGLGRKESGSYYTPHPFVRFLVQQTLGPQVRQQSPDDEPNPAAILQLKVLDPAMGSGHFLVEACRFLGDCLYEACRLCAELVTTHEEAAAQAAEPAGRARHHERARVLRQRLAALPVAADELLGGQPGRCERGGSLADAPFRERGRALAAARRLVAGHCLYGVDRNPLAVELAKLALWLEAHAEGLPLTFLDRHLICGDSLTGPALAQLLFYPGSGEPVADGTSPTLPGRLHAALDQALSQLRAPASSGGAAVSVPGPAALAPADFAVADLAVALAPFRLLAAAFSGGVQLGASRAASEGCDDAAYSALLTTVAAGRDPQPLLATFPRLQRMIELGRRAVSYELAFPEVFFPAGEPGQQGGFAAVVGNPPWEAVQPRAKEFYAGFELGVLDAPTRRERRAVEARLNTDPQLQAAFGEYVGALEKTRRVIGRLYRKVSRSAGDTPSGAVTDLWQAFAERGLQLLQQGGRVGWVLPSAFHANQSSTGLRELYLSQSALQCCYSFANSKKLFDIHSSFKFAAVVAERTPRGTSQFACAFHLQDPAWLFGEAPRLFYTRELVQQTGGDYLSFLELRTPADAVISALCFAQADRVGSWCAQRQLRLAVELDMTKSAHRFVAAASCLPTADSRAAAHLPGAPAEGLAPIHEGKTFHQYEDRWEARPRYLLRLTELADQPDWLQRARHYRLAFRTIASSTNERTGICCLLPPGCFFGNSALCEKTPQRRPNSAALLLLSLANSFSFDWLLRNKAGANINAFILNGCPLPPASPHRDRFLVHAALRLTANHSGYAALLAEQVGAQPGAPGGDATWPLLAGESARWAVRAAIDAVVAQAYGLTREQYAHVLASFSHKSHPPAAARCLAAFDELSQLGLEAYARRHDPYRDVPLNPSLPVPPYS